MYCYGIDLGTTYSCVARTDDNGNVEVIKNIEGKYVTPSVVEFISPSEIIVGETAKGDSILAPENVVLYIKRSMGKQDETFEHHGIKYTPEQISAFIIKKLVEDAEAVTGDKITEVVITVPAYFGFDERQATENAGRIAGLDVLAIVNEPTAAAIAYGEQSKSKEDKVVLVYDLGGGTFDITVAEIVGEKITVISTEGNHTLGGKDWDAELMSYFISQFCEATGVTEDEIYDDTEILNELVIKTEEAKKELTTKNTASFSLSMGRGKRAKVEVSIEKFDEITRHHLLSTIELTKVALQQASTKMSSKGKPCNQIDEIIFVGGSTRMRQVKEAMKKELDMEPQIFEPDEAVARGAALLARLVMTDKQEAEKAGNKTIEISSRLGEVTSKSYGTDAIVDGINKLCHIILKNDPIPTTKTQTFSTSEDNQRRAGLAVYESNIMEEYTDLSYGNPLWECDENSSPDDKNAPFLELPDGLPKGTKIEITFSLDLNGLLSVTAIEKSSGKKCDFSIKTKGLSDDKVLELQEKTSAIKIAE